jgi:hypothetical protein
MKIKLTWLDELRQIFRLTWFMPSQSIHAQNLRFCSPVAQLAEGMAENHASLTTRRRGHAFLNVRSAEHES